MRVKLGVGYIYTFWNTSAIMKQKTKRVKIVESVIGSKKRLCKDEDKTQPDTTQHDTKRHDTTRYDTTRHDTT